MSTKETVQKYYDGVVSKGDWQSIISDNMSFVSPVGNTKGKPAYVEATTRFLGIVTNAMVKELIIEGDKTCALVDYSIVSPTGEKGNCVVAEILSTKDDKIDSSTIFFDTAAFRAFYGSSKLATPSSK
jgi:ketosteroid isomerase-like protein